MSRVLTEGIGHFSDEQLVARIKLGEYEYFTLLLNRYMPHIVNAASKYKSVCEMDDLVSEGVLAFFSAIKSYERDKSSFGTFADLCVNRAIVSQYRHIKASKRIPSELISSIDDVDIFDNKNPENMLIEKESLKSLSDAIKSILSDFEFKVFCGFITGKKYGKIAEELGVDVKSVDNALRRVREKLKR